MENLRTRICWSGRSVGTKGSRTVIYALDTVFAIDQTVLYTILATHCHFTDISLSDEEFFCPMLVRMNAKNCVPYIRAKSCDLDWKLQEVRLGLKHTVISNVYGALFSFVYSLPILQNCTTSKMFPAYRANKTINGEIHFYLLLPTQPASYRARHQ